MLTLILFTWNLIVVSPKKRMRKFYNTLLAFNNGFKIYISLLILPTLMVVKHFLADFRTHFPPFSPSSCMFNAVAAANNLKWCKENLLMIEWKKPRLIEPIQSPRGALLFFRLPLALSSPRLHIPEPEQQILNWAWKVFFVLHTSLLICRPQTPNQLRRSPIKCSTPSAWKWKVLNRHKNEKEFVI
jgi:hypothetical protein